MISKSLFIILILVSQSVLAVVGGVPIQETEAAWSSTVNVKMKRGMCTGSVLTNRVVITAAHCRDLFGEVELVAHIHSGPTQKCGISMVTETSYTPSAQNKLYGRVHAPDIILLRLATPLCGVKTAEIDSAPIQVGNVYFGAGHGRGNAKYGQIEKFELKIIDKSEVIEAIYPMQNWVEDFLSEGLNAYQFALPVKEKSSFCHGDSGGPIYREVNDVMKISGVNGAVLFNEKLGSDGCDKAYLQAIAPVAPYADWIESKIAEWNVIQSSALLVD